MSSRSKTVCEICGESFLTENKLSNHITERHVHSSTSPSSSVCSSSKRRKMDADSDVRCPLCDYVDLDTDRLQQHVNRMHFDPGSPRRPGTVDFPCPICPLAFDHCDSLESHITEEHHDIVNPRSVMFTVRTLRKLHVFFILICDLFFNCRIRTLRGYHCWKISTKVVWYVEWKISIA